MTRTSPKLHGKEEVKSESGANIILQPRSPLHEHDWQDCLPLCPCGESHSFPSIETTLQNSSTGTDAAPDTAGVEAEDNDDNKSTCSSCGGRIVEMPEAIKCWWDTGAAEWELANNRSGSEAAISDLTITVAQPSNEVGESPDVDEGKEDGEEIDNAKSTFSSCDGERGQPLQVIKCFWDPQTAENQDVNKETEAPASLTPTSNNNGVQLPERQPALQSCAWWAGFQSPNHAFRTLVQAKHSIQHFERIIAEAKSLQARQYLGHSVDTVPQSFAPRARKALEKKYLAEFEWLTKEDAERMAQESMEWVWLKKARAIPFLVEDEVINYFDLEDLVEEETFAYGVRGWRH